MLWEPGEGELGIRGGKQAGPSSSPAGPSFEVQPFPSRLLFVHIEAPISLSPVGSHLAVSSHVWAGRGTALSQLPRDSHFSPSSNAWSARHSTTTAEEGKLP